MPYKNQYMRNMIFVIIIRIRGNQLQIHMQVIEILSLRINLPFQYKLEI